MLFSIFNTAIRLVLAELSQKRIIVIIYNLTFKLSGQVPTSTSNQTTGAPVFSEVSINTYDVDPTSSHYGDVIRRLKMPAIDDESYHIGCNA